MTNATLFRATCAALALGLLAGCGRQGRESSQPDTAPTAAVANAVKGRLSLDGQPLTGVTVSCVYYIEPGSPGRRETSTRTDDQGGFRLDGISRSIGTVRWMYRKGNRTLSRVFPLSSSELSTDIVSKGNVTGTLVSAAGVTSPSNTIRIVRVKQGLTGLRSKDKLWTREEATDFRLNDRAVAPLPGQFAFRNLPAGTYAILPPSPQPTGPPGRGHANLPVLFAPVIVQVAGPSTNVTIACR